MACGACERRKKRMERKRAAKLAKGKKVQAAAIGAVLAVTEAAGKALGIHGEVEDARDRQVGGGNRPTHGSPEPDR